MPCSRVTLRKKSPKYFLQSGSSIQSNHFLVIEPEVEYHTFIELKRAIRIGHLEALDSTEQV